jgi:Zn-dependent protease with chaperone function
VSTQFFERQEAQRSYTRWLVLGFISAIVAVVFVITLAIVVGILGDPVFALRHHPWFAFWVASGVLAVILVACWHKSAQMRAGGAAVARSLGGVPITASEGDLKRRQLLNIVEEMAIAARIRKPQVFVLPGESGINAFAAGHSPDEAAVAVTQGALDRLDREQLQAVIGHEFSHILNGDMKINMRLTAWIFGLMIITVGARRILNSRSRGKGAGRIKLIALAIFIAGSVGMFAGRLLQAAVSRRREHLADASAVQFTRNPQALQGAFIVMAASHEGTRLQHAASDDVAHMFFAGSEPAWMSKFGGSWLATHPPLEERVRALDSRVTPTKYRAMVSDERRKLAARAAREAAEANARPAEAPHAPVASPAPTAAALAASGEALSMALGEVPLRSAAGAAAPGDTADDTQRTRSGVNTSITMSRMALAETLPSGVRLVAGRQLPPDVLRNRLSQEQQVAISTWLAQVEKSPLAVQGTFVALMLAGEPARWRPQLTKLAPVLGIQLLKETQEQVGRLPGIAPAARMALACDLVVLLDTVDAADRKRLRAIARAFAPTVATGDMLRFGVTRLLERKLARPAETPPPVPLPERAAAACDFYMALAQCRFGAGKGGLNSYRAGLMGMLPPQKWAPFAETLLAPAAIDAALAALAQVHPTGKRSLSEGMARVIAVGGKLTVPQVDLLRAACLLIDCPVPVLPVDVIYEEADVLPAATQANVR